MGEISEEIMMLNLWFYFHYTLIHCWCDHSLTKKQKSSSQKLYEYIGDALEYIINGAQSKSVFRLIRDRVFYVNSTIASTAINVPREELLTAGLFVGKFTKGGKFRLNINCLDYIAKYCKNKICVKRKIDVLSLWKSRDKSPHNKDDRKHSSIRPSVRLQLEWPSFRFWSGGKRNLPDKRAGANSSGNIQPSWYRRIHPYRRRLILNSFILWIWYIDEK